MAIREGYKVLSPRRWSVWVTGEGGGAVQYLINKWTRPRPHCGPLAVFETLLDAVYWSDANGNLPDGCTIHRCQYKQSRFSHLWRLVSGEKREKPLFGLPAGSGLANAVRTLE